MTERIEISDYLLGELSGSELEEAERLMREDPSFREQVERLRPTVARLEELPDEAWAAGEPPPLELERESSEAPPLASTADGEPARRWWHARLSLPRLGVALASLALLAIGLGGGLLLSADGDDPPSPTETLALEPVEPRGDGASGSAQLAGSAGGEVTVEVTDTPANAPGEFYELWLLSAPDDLVSLGSFKVGETGSATVSVPLPVDPKEFEFIDLSLESADGDASHSGRSILRART